MKLVICAVYDKAVGAFLTPFFTRSKGEALRSFTEACNDPKVPFGKNAGDFTLFGLGEFDDGSGLFNTGEPQRLLSALEAVDVDVTPRTAPN